MISKIYYKNENKIISLLKQRRVAPSISSINSSHNFENPMLLRIILLIDEPPLNNSYNIN